MEGGLRGREVSDRPGDNKGSLVLVSIEVNMQQGEDMQHTPARCIMKIPYNTIGGLQNSDKLPDSFCYLGRYN